MELIDELSKNTLNMLLPKSDDGFKYFKNRITYPGRSINGFFEDMGFLENQLLEKIDNGDIIICVPKYLWLHSKLIIDVKKINEKLHMKCSPDLLSPYIIVIPLTRKVIPIQQWEAIIINSLKEVIEINEAKVIINEIIFQNKNKIPMSSAEEIIILMEKKGIIRYSISSQIEYHTDLIEGYYFDYETRPLPHHQIKSPELNNFKISITEDCNQECIYCYYTENKKVKRHKMTESTLYRSIDFILKTAQYKKHKRISISWWGGDPAEESELLIKGVHYANRIFANASIYVRHSICSSFTTADSEKIISLISENNIDVTISCDGYKELHDSHRPLKKGETYVLTGYDLMEKSRIKLLALGCLFTEKLETLIAKQNGFYISEDKLKDMKKLFKIKQRCNIYNDTEIDNYDILCDYLDQFNQQYRICYATRENNLSSKKKYGEKILNAIKKAEDKLISNYPNNLLDIKSIFLNMHTNPLDGINFCYSRCGFGGGIVIINTMGNIYSCHRFCDLNDYRIGTINDLPENVEKKCCILKKRWLGKYEPCASCKLRPYCSSGGCAHEAFEYYGTTDKNAGCISMPMLSEKAKLTYIFNVLYPDFDNNILNLEDGAHARHCWYY